MVGQTLSLDLGSFSNIAKFSQEYEENHRVLAIIVRKLSPPKKNFKIRSNFSKASSHKNKLYLFRFLPQTFFRKYSSESSKKENSDIHELDLVVPKME